MPMPVVRYLPLELMFQVDWVHIEGISNQVRILDPHGRTVKIHQQPFVGVEVEALGILHSIQYWPEKDCDLLNLNFELK